MRASFLQSFPELQGKRVLLFLGRIHPKKGCDLLVEAFAAVGQSESSWHLVMAGPDDVGMQAVLAQHAARLGLKNITWTGMLEGDLKWGALHAAEAFVLPSHQENFGIAVTEALACGTPVLISNKVNIWREIVADGAGLVEDDSLAGTRQLLRSWFDLSAAERELMANNAAQCFTRRFHIHSAARRLHAAILNPSAQAAARAVPSSTNH
jgi:glycosyltransferase involved in cell wall biosynthesis